MINLNAQIIAYLTVNNIAYTSGDYQTGEPPNEPDQILEWDTAKLGAKPTQAQLNAATPIYEGQQQAKKNKEAATELLKKTDWTATVDIADPQYSNPHLLNQADFLTYRSLVRTIAVNPPTTPAVFPTLPTAIWS